MTVPDFPHWVNWWAIFAGLSFIPLTTMPFFMTGPRVGPPTGVRSIAAVNGPALIHA
jgi:hypothetical protein